MISVRNKKKEDNTTDPMNTRRMPKEYNEQFCAHNLMGEMDWCLERNKLPRCTPERDNMDSSMCQRDNMDNPCVKRGDATVKSLLPQKAPGLDAARSTRMLTSTQGFRNRVHNSLQPFRRQKQRAHYPKAKPTKRHHKINICHEYRYNYPQQMYTKLNPTIYKENYTPRSAGFILGRQG